MGATDLVYLQSKKEASWATDAAATARWMSADKFNFKPMPVWKMARYQRGDLAPAHQVYKTSEHGEGTIEGDVTFEEIIQLWGSAVKGGVSPATVDTSAKTWTYPAPLTASPALDTRIFEVYDGGQCYQALGMVCKSFGLSGQAGSEAMVRYTSQWIGKKVEAASVTGALGNRTVEAIPANMMALYIDALGGTMGSTIKADTLINWNVNYETGAHLKQFQSGAVLPSSIGFAKPAVSFQITAEFNSVGIAEMTAFLAGTGRLIRLEGLGSLAGAATKYRTFRVDLAVQHLTVDDLYGDRDGNTTVTLSGGVRYDTASFANYASFEATNILSAYADA